MKMRAAVLEEFGEPLAVQEVELAEPRAGEVLVRLVACGVCHTDLYTASGADPSGYAPTVLGHEGAGVVEQVGAGRHLARARATTSSPSSRPSAASASTASTRGPTSAWRSASSRTRASCPTAPPGSPATATEIRHFMGCSTFAEYTVMPEIALAKVNPEAPFEHACLFACGLSTGLGAAINTAAVQPGSTCVVFGAGMVGLGAVAGCRLQGAERIVCVDLSAGAARAGPRPGRDRPDRSAARARSSEILEMTGGFGADYTFEATGNVAVMRQAVEAARMAWGLCTVAGVAGKGETLDVVPRLLITGRRVAGSSFGGVKGRDQVPVLIDALPGRRDRRRALHLPPHRPRRGQPRLRADGGPGRHPQRDRVR